MNLGPRDPKLGTTLPPGPEVIKLFSCSTQLSMIFVLVINLKLLTIANSFLLNIAEHEKSFITLGPGHFSIQRETLLTIRSIFVSTGFFRKEVATGVSSSESEKSVKKKKKKK